MKKAAFVVLAVALMLGLSSFTVAPRVSIEGSWVGQFQVNSTDGSVRTNFWVEDGELKGTIDIPSEGIFGLPLEWIILDSTYVHFELIRQSETLVFDGSVRGGLISGDFSSRAERGTFRLMKESLVLQ